MVVNIVMKRMTKELFLRLRPYAGASMPNVILFQSQY